jgi:hypothetical protein
MRPVTVAISATDTIFMVIAISLSITIFTMITVSLIAFIAAFYRQLHITRSDRLHRGSCRDGLG